MPRLTDAEIAEAKRLCGEATLEPWSDEDGYIRGSSAKTLTGRCMVADFVPFQADRELILLARTLLPRLIEEVAALRADRDRLDELQRLVLDGADIVRDDERLIVFIQKDDSRTCGPLYVYRGDGENALRDAVDAARK